MPKILLNLTSEFVAALDGFNGLSDRVPNFFFFISQAVESVDTVDAVDDV